MRAEDRQYEVTPKVVRAGSRARISIRPRYVTLRGPFRVTVSAMAGRGGSTSAVIDSVALCDGALVFTYDFPAEQEYLLALEELTGEKPRFLAELRLYALDEDLFPLRPWKGDLHMHSSRSDGAEEPAYVAGACRRIGMDFMALTDHRLYEPSLEAIRAFQGCPTDLLILPGEEVHPPDCPVHIVNAGGSASVNALFDSEAFRREVGLIADSLSGLPPELRRSYAICAWCFDRIRALGGIGILAHPYWVTHSAYNVAEPLLELLFERMPFDALELIGGFYRFQVESNALQVSRYHEERCRGRSIPAVGSSDAHGCERGELFGWYYSVVYSPSLGLRELRAAIQGLRSVAVEALPGEQPRAHGPFRLAAYTHFLLREVFPLHDELAEEEGRYMLRWLEGDPESRAALARWQGRTAGLYDRLWQAAP